MDINRSNNVNGSVLPENHSNNVNSTFSAVKTSPTKLCQNDKQKQTNIETFSESESDTIISNCNGAVVGLNNSKNNHSASTFKNCSLTNCDRVAEAASAAGCDDANSDIVHPVRIENDENVSNSSFRISPKKDVSENAFRAISTNDPVDFVLVNDLASSDDRNHNNNSSQYNDYINQTYTDTSRRQSVQNDDESRMEENVRLLIDSVPPIKLHSFDNKLTTNPIKATYAQKTNEKLPRSIVKSPSSNSFNKHPNDIKTRHRLSLQCSKNTNNANGPTMTDESSEPPGEYERPVLHVQFMSNDHDPVIGSSISDRRSDGKSPLGSITSNSSSESGSTSTTSSSDDDASSIGPYSEARAPDGGWGWVVVFASFMVNLIADGITFSFGVIFVEFLNYFGEGKAKTAWIGSLFMAIPLLSGPIASFLTDRYGCRKVTIAGSILASAGFVISSFANSMEMLFFTFGILAGFGLSLCYVAAVVIVAYYFEKKRSFATGLSVCGSGIGTFIFAPLTQMLLEEYGWRGTTLILAGIFLNMTVCGMLMRDLEWTTHRAKLKRKERKRSSKLGVSADSFSVSNSTNTGGTASNLNQEQTTEMPTAPEINDIKVEDLGDPRLFSSLITLPTFVKNGEKVPVEVMELLSTHRNGHNLLMQNYPGLLYSRSFSEPHSSHTGIPAPEANLSPSNKDHGKAAKKKPQTNTEQFHNEQALLTWLRKHQSHPHHHRDHRAPPSSSYLKDLRMHRHSLTYRGAMLNINRYRLRASSCPDIYRNSMTTIAKEKSQWRQGIAEFKNLFVDILDFSYFADIRFLLFAISNFLLYTWYDVPYVYLTDNAIEMGFAETDASMLIGIIGIVNMFGEIALGWVGDVKGISASVVYAVCMTLCGAITAMVPLSSSYTWLCAISGLFGLFIAANYSLTSIILVELITLERFTNAYGLLLLVQGVANLVGPPLAGWIYDVTGTYDLSFYIAGFFIAVSGAMLGILPALGRYRKYRTLKRRTPSDEYETRRIPNTPEKKECNGTTVLTDCFNNELPQETVKPNQV